MRRLVWLVSGVLAFAMVVRSDAADEKKNGSYQQVSIDRGLFVGEGRLAMLEQEKKSMAKLIAAHVVNELAQKVSKGDRGATELAERMICVALNLDQRNRTAIVANFQLGRGVVPGKVEAEYSPEVLSQLLVTRAKLLRGADDGASTVLAGFLFEIAVEVFPRNEDAIYELEMFRLDEAPVDWALLRPESVGK